MTDSQGPLVLNNFQTAVADSPHLGHALMRQVDIESFPGAMRVQRRSYGRIITIGSAQTFTAVAATDICTAPLDLRDQSTQDQNLSYVGAAVTFSTSNTLPAPLVAGTVYFLIYVSNNTFKVATTLANANAGTAIDLTTTGTGTHTVTGVTIGTILHIRKDYRSNYIFALDSNGRVWNTQGGQTFHLLAGNTITNTTGNGLALFRTSDGLKTYLFVFRAAVIDVIEVTGDSQINSPSWTSSWQSMNTSAGSSNTHYAIVAQDNIIYFCDSRFVGSILEKAGQVFDPSSSATYTYNNQALDTPQDEILNHLEELGTNLLAGGLTYNKIYPWDRLSSSFALPLLVPEVGVYKMKNAGNVVYILAGMKGNIYQTPGTYVSLFKTIPGYIKNNGTTVTPTPVTWGGLALKPGGVIVGLAGQNTGQSGAYLVFDDGRLTHDAVPYGGSQNVTAIFADSDFYVMGYAGNIDIFDNNRFAQGTFAAVYNSPLVRVSDKTTKATYSQLEVQIAKPATTGQIRIGYRFDESSSFTVLDTYTADSVTTSFQTDIGLTDIENIQIQAEYDGNIELMQIKLSP